MTLEHAVIIWLAFALINAIIYLVGVSTEVGGAYKKPYKTSDLLPIIVTVLTGPIGFVLVLIIFATAFSKLRKKTKNKRSLKSV